MNLTQPIYINRIINGKNISLILYLIIIQLSI